MQLGADWAGGFQLGGSGLNQLYGLLTLHVFAVLLFARNRDCVRGRGGCSDCSDWIRQGFLPFAADSANLSERQGGVRLEHENGGAVSVGLVAEWPALARVCRGTSR